MARCAAGVLRVKGLKVALLFLLVGWSSAGLPPDKQNEYVDVNPRPAEDAAQKPPGGGGGVVADHLFGDPDLDEEQQTEGAYKVVFARDGTEIRPHHDSMAHDQLVTVGQQDVAIHKPVIQGSALTEEVSQKDVRAHQASRERSALAEKVSQDDVPSHKATSEGSALVEQVSQQAVASSDGGGTWTNATTGEVQCCANLKRPWGLASRVCTKFQDSCPGYLCGGKWETRKPATDPPISAEVACREWKCELTIGANTYCKDVPDVKKWQDKIWQDVKSYGNGRFYCPEDLFGKQGNRQSKYTRRCKITAATEVPDPAPTGEVQGEKKCCHYAAVDDKGVADYKQCVYAMWDGKCGGLKSKLNLPDKIHRCRLDEFGDHACRGTGAPQESGNKMCDTVKMVLTHFLNLKDLFAVSSSRSDHQRGSRVRGASWTGWSDESTDAKMTDFRDVTKKVSKKAWKSWASHVKLLNADAKTVLDYTRNGRDTFSNSEQKESTSQEIDMLRELTFGDVFSEEWYHSERWRMREVGLMTEFFGPGEEGGIQAIHVDSALAPFDKEKLGLKDMSLQFMWILQSDFRIRRVIRKACGLEAVNKRPMVDYWLETQTSELWMCKNAVNQQLAIDQAKMKEASAAADVKTVPEVDPDEEGASARAEASEAEEVADNLVTEGTEEKQYEEELRELSKTGSETARLMAEQNFKDNLADFDGKLATLYSNLKENITMQFPKCKGIPADTLLAFAEWVAQQKMWDFAPPSPLWKMDDAAPLGKSAHHGHGTCTVTGHRRGSAEFPDPARRSAELTCPEGTRCRCPKSIFFKKRNLKVIRSGVDTKQIAHYTKNGATGFGIKAAMTTTLSLIGHAVGPVILLAVAAYQLKKGQFQRAGLSVLAGLIGAGVGLAISLIPVTMPITILLVAISALPMFFLGRYFSSLTQRCEARLACYPADVEERMDGNLRACGMGVKAKLGGSPAWFLPAPGTAVLLQADGKKCSKMNLCSADALVTQEIGFKKVTVDGVDKGWSVFNCQPFKVSEMKELDEQRTDKLSVKFAKRVWETAKGTVWQPEAWDLCEKLRAGCPPGGAFLNMSLASSAIEAPGIVQHRKKKQCQAANDAVLKHESSLVEEVLHEVRSIGAFDGQ